MLTTGELYNDLGGDYFQRRDPERQTKRLVRQLEALGHTVTLETNINVNDRGGGRSLNVIFLCSSKSQESCHQSQPARTIMSMAWSRQVPRRYDSAQSGESSQARARAAR